MSSGNSPLAGKGSLSSPIAHRAGTFCFAELVSPDPVTAQQFYGDLFGWSVEEVIGSSEPYWLFHLEGQVVAGLRRIPRGRQRWIPYVSVERVDAACLLAERLGARIGQERFDVSGLARLATIVDPHERTIGLWEARERSGVDRQSLPGSMWWVEMLAHDMVGATHFYSSLFGWRTTTRALPHLMQGYTVYTAGTESVGGAITIERNWGNVPERWQVLFAVTDVKQTIWQAEGLSGCQDLPLLEIPNVGRCTALLDDRGGLFIAMQPAAVSGV